jgi:hypothetical protein
VVLPLSMRNNVENACGANRKTLSLEVAEKYRGFTSIKADRFASHRGRITLETSLKCLLLFAQSCLATSGSEVPATFHAPLLRQLFLEGRQQVLSKPIDRFSVAPLPILECSKETEYSHTMEGSK